MARINKILLALFVFFLPWQTKYILKADSLNYWEIAIFSSSILALIIVVFNLNKIIELLKKLNKAQLIFLIVFDLSLFISIFLSPNFFLSLYRYLIFFLAILLFLLLVNLKDKLYLLFIFLISISGHLLIAIWQFLSQISLSNKFLGLSHHYAWQLGTAVIEVNGQRWLRAYGALDHPNILGAMAVISAVISFYFLLFKNNKAYIQILLFLNFFLAFSALVFSFSRSAWLAFVISIAIFIFSKIKNKSTFYLLLIASITLFSVFYFNYSHLINTRILAQGRIEQISIGERKSSLDLIKFESTQQLLLGRGIGASTYWQREVDVFNNEHFPAYSYQPIHNIFLLLLLEIGFLGLMSFLAFLIFLVFNNKKKIKANLSLFLLPVFLIFALFDHWLISLPFGVFLLFFFLSFTNE